MLNGDVHFIVAIKLTNWLIGNLNCSDAGIFTTYYLDEAEYVTVTLLIFKFDGVIIQSNV